MEPTASAAQNKEILCPPEECPSPPLAPMGVQRLDFLPVAMAIVRKMGVAEGIDEVVGPPPPGPQVIEAKKKGQEPPPKSPSVGLCIIAMMLNILEGRVALMNMEQWLRGIEGGTLWESDINPDQFTNDRLARALDAVFDIGLDGLYTRIVAKVIEKFQVPTKRLHDDGTTVKVYGEYDRGEEEEGPRAMRGHSKDHRPDLLQFAFGEEDRITQAIEFSRDKILIDTHVKYVIWRAIEASVCFQITNPNPGDHPDWS